MKTATSPLVASAILSLFGSLAAAESASSADFSVLSFNVAGLLAILNGNGDGDKETYATEIGERFAEYDYDVIQVQEDFNYHAYIYATDDHPYRTATSGGAGIGSGLNTLANFDWLDFERDKWDTCSDASENDCLTPKGFTFMRVRFDEGVYVDFYNLHTDAGTEAGDETARNANIQQVIDYVDVWSVGNAVMIFGDTNSRYSRTDDDLTPFADAGFTDAWVHLIMNDVAPAKGSDPIVCETPIPSTNQCEVVDKVFYRSSPFIAITGNDFVYDSERFLNDTGNGLLSDHIPVRVDLTWSLVDDLRASDQIGGPHGDWYNDLESIPASPVATTLTVRGGSRVDAVSLTLSDGTTFTHGGTGGDAYSLTIAAGDYVVSAYLCTAEYDSHTRVFYALFTTKNGQTVTAGVTTDDCYTVTAPSGMGLVGFYGRSGDEVDRLGLYWGTQ